MKKSFEYLGKTVNTQYYDDLNGFDEELYNKIVSEFYSKDYDKMVKQLKGVLFNNKVMINHIYEYFFEEVANDTVLHNSRWSINEALASKDVMSLMFNKIKEKPKVFGDIIDVKSVKTCFRIGNVGIASKASNFPLKECNRILRDYTTGNKKLYIDTSAGWGVRMLSSAANDINYIGFDVNTKLIPKLELLGDLIKQFKPNWNYKIIPNGSEIYVPELENKADIMFTSPPYFFLEDYRNGKQSATEDTSYEDWCKNFLKPTIENSYKYSANGSYMLFNIKDYKDFDMESKSKEYGIAAGYEFVGYTSLKNIQRVIKKDDKNILMDNSEDIIVFKK